jgi:hypothetical protein
MVLWSAFINAHIATGKHLQANLELYRATEEQLIID